jgi:hypothetical protein
VRIFTHEFIVHSQLESIETALNRSIDFKITLNQKRIASSIEFDVNSEEISTLKHDLGLNVLIFDGKRWLPHM